MAQCACSECTSPSAWPRQQCGAGLAAICGYTLPTSNPKTHTQACKCPCVATQTDVNLHLVLKTKAQLLRAFTSAPAFSSAISTLFTRLGCPLPMPNRRRSRATVIALLLTCFTQRQAKRRSSSWSAVGCAPAPQTLKPKGLQQCCEVATDHDNRSRLASSARFHSLQHVRKTNLAFTAYSMCIKLTDGAVTQFKPSRPANEHGAAAPASPTRR